MISIIIPVYNGEKYIKQCIISAINQTADKEIIVINDGSTDGTADVLNMFGDKINVLTRHKNEGTSSALNIGILASQGQYIYLLGADDYLFEDNSLERLLDYVGKTNNDKVICHSDGGLVDENGKTFSMLPTWDYTSLTQIEQSAMMFVSFFASMPTCLIPRSLFDEVGLFDETMRYAEDYDFWLRSMLLHGVSFEKVPRTTVMIRQHDNQLTRVLTDGIKKRDELKARIFAQLDKHNQDTLMRYVKKTESEIPFKIRVKNRFARMNAHLPSTVAKAVQSTYRKYDKIGEIDE